MATREPALNTGETRRQNRIEPASSAEASSIWFEIGPWRVDPGALTLCREGTEIRLAAKPMQVLCCLLATPGTTVTRKALIDHVWHGNRYVAPKGINNAIWTLRKHLDDEWIQIETVPKQGYRLQASAPVNSHPAQPAQAQGRAWRRLSGALSACALVGVIIAARPETSEPPPLILESNALELPVSRAFTPAISPDGHTLAYAGRTPNGHPDIYLHPLTTEGHRQTYTTPYAERQPQWGPEGVSLAYLRWSGIETCQVLIHDLEQDHVRQLDTCDPQAAAALAWSPVHGLLAYYRPSEDGVLLTVRAADETRPRWQRRVVHPPDTASALAWSPDGRTLAATLQPTVGDTEILLLAADDGAHRSTLRPAGTVGDIAWADSRYLIMDARQSSGSRWLWSLDRETSRIQPLLTSATVSMQADIHPSGRQLVFHQQGFHTTVGHARLADDLEPPELLPTERRDYLPAPCGPDAYVTVSEHHGGRQLWWQNRADTTNGKDSDALTPPAWHASAPACDASGRWLAFIGDCEDRRSPTVCLMDLRSESTRAITTPTQLVSGLPAWDGPLLLIPVHQASSRGARSPSDGGGEILRLRTDGHLIARHILPFPAARVRAHPRQPALLISSPKRSGIWRIDNSSGDHRRLPVDWPALSWGLWEVSRQGLLLARRVPDGTEITRHDWSGSRPPQRQTWPGIQPRDNGRLMWQAHEQRLWMIHVERPYTQLRLARVPQS